jgi:hypothetical protein
MTTHTHTHDGAVMLLHERDRGRCQGTGEATRRLGKTPAAVVEGRTHKPTAAPATMTATSAMDRHDTDDLLRVGAATGDGTLAASSRRSRRSTSSSSLTASSLWPPGPTSEARARSAALPRASTASSRLAGVSRSLPTDDGERDSRRRITRVPYLYGTLIVHCGDSTAS